MLFSWGVLHFILGRSIFCRFPQVFYIALKAFNGFYGFLWFSSDFLEVFMQKTHGLQGAFKIALKQNKPHLLPPTPTTKRGLTKGFFMCLGHKQTTLRFAQDLCYAARFRRSRLRCFRAANTATGIIGKAVGRSIRCTCFAVSRTARKHLALGSCLKRFLCYRVFYVSSEDCTFLFKVFYVFSQGVLCFFCRFCMVFKSFPSSCVRVYAASVFCSWGVLYSLWRFSMCLLDAFYGFKGFQSLSVKVFYVSP